MRKDQEPSPCQRPPEPVKPLVPFRFILLGIVVSPFLFEAGLLCYARWVAILGTVRSVRTPLLDWTWELGKQASEKTSAFFHSVPWGRELVVMVGLGCFAVCSLLLRVRRDR